MLKSITFEVIGEQQIHCESCERRIERTLKTVQGVRQARAQARDQRIRVLFDAKVLDSTVIAARLAEAGYKTRSSHGAFNLVH